MAGDGTLSGALSGGVRAVAGARAPGATSWRIGVMRPLMLALWAAGILRIFLDSELLAFAMVGGLVLFVLLAWPGAAPFNRWIGGIATGLVLLISGLTGNWQPAWDGLVFSLVFIAFLPTLQLIRRTLEATPEVGASREVFAGMPARERSTGVMVGAHVLGSVLTLGVFAIMAPLAPKEADMRARRELAFAAIRGMGMVILWSPFSLGMAFALSLRPEVPLWQAIAAGLGLAAIGLVIAVLMFDRAGGLGSILRALAGFRPLLLPLLGAMGGVVAVASLTPLSNIQAVVLAMPVLCLLWLLRRGPGPVPPVVHATWQGLPRLGDEFMLFVAAVTLGKVLAALPQFTALFTHPAFMALPTPAVLATFMAIAFALPMVGLHPLVSAGILFAILTTLGERLADIVAVQAFLFGWAVGASLSVASMSLTVSSSLFRVPIGRLMYRENALFMAAFGIVAFAVLAGANTLLLP